MASSRSNAHSDTAKTEQIVTEFFTKTLQIILESRSSYSQSWNYCGEQAVLSPSSSSSPSSSGFRTRDKWFNLALRECPTALENVDFWRQSNLEPMVVDVILVKQSLNCDPTNFSPKGQAHNRSERIIERWVVQYEGRKSKKVGGNLKTLYKKSIVLLRSLYVTMKLLPAYKLFRDMHSSWRVGTYTLTHRVSSFVEPFTRREEADKQLFCFTPIDTSCGRLCLSVSYQSSVFDVSSEPSTPMSPRFITDYVGSPLANPLKRFPSLPVSRDSPSCSPFSRRHSWSYENYQASSPSTLPSPSPTYSDSHTSVSKCRSRIPPPLSLPQTGLKNTGYDEYWPSPVYTASPSPSPPIYTSKHIQSKVISRCESAPVSIPANIAFNKQNLPPSPSAKLRRAATLKSDKSIGASGSSVEKFSYGRDESGRFSGVRLSANSSPRISYSRSSSRMSIEDDYDDSEFACHFIVDDDDAMNPGSRENSFDQKGQSTDPHERRGSASCGKSQDAAVGALVLMLKKAPPLRQDVSGASKTTSCGKPEEMVHTLDEKQSRYSMLKTTAEALEELQSYKQMKDSLLCQGYRSLVFDKKTDAEGVPGRKPM